MKKIRKYDRHNSHWWSHEKKETDWAIQDKDGNWWLVSGSEFPEKKVEKKKIMKCGLPPTFDFKALAKRVFYAALIGSSIGIIVGIAMSLL